MLTTLFTKQKISFVGLFIVSIAGTILAINGFISAVSEDMDAFGTTVTQTMIEDWPIAIWGILGIAVLFLSIAFLRSKVTPDKTARIGATIFCVTAILTPLLPFVISPLFMSPGQENGLGAGLIAGFFIGGAMLLGILCALTAVVMLVMGYAKTKQTQRAVLANASQIVERL